MKLVTFALAAFLAAPAAAQVGVCSATLVGAGCGPTLDITFSPVGTAGNQRIQVAVSGLHSDGIAVMVWGNNQVNYTLPFSNCPMFTEFLWGHQVNPDATGSYHWSRSWPASVPGFYYIQFGSLAVVNGAFETRSSDCLLATCHM